MIDDDSSTTLEFYAELHSDKEFRNWFRFNARFRGKIRRIRQEDA